jgi:hypothetical protein
VCAWSSFPEYATAKGVVPVEGTISSQRAAENQSLYRAANERIKELNEVFAEVDSAPGDWICECANTECTSRISATVQEYESVRSNPRKFIVYPGHVYPEVERVVAGNERFTTVEKIGDAGEVAEELAPHMTEPDSKSRRMRLGSA